MRFTIFSLASSLFVAACAGSALPSIAIEHNRAGTEHLAAHRLDQAEARFRLALEYRPRFAEPHANLGLVAYLRGHLHEAEDQLRVAVDLNEDFAAAWANLGVVLEQEDRLDDARDAYERSLRVDPGQTAARRNLAFLLARGGLFPEARAHLMRLVEIDGEDVEAAGVLAWCELRLGRPTEASQRAEAILLRDPDAATARLVRGAALAARGDFDDAYNDLSEASTHSVLAREATRRLAAVELLRGHVLEADALVRELLGDDERDAAAHLVAASIALAESEFSEVRQHASTALMIRPDLAEAHLLLAEVAARTGDASSMESELAQIGADRFSGDISRIRGSLLRR